MSSGLLQTGSHSGVSGVSGVSGGGVSGVSGGVSGVSGGAVFVLLLLDVVMFCYATEGNVCSECEGAQLTSSAFQAATFWAFSPTTSGSSWQCLSQQRATRW